MAKKGKKRKGTPQFKGVQDVANRGVKVRPGSAPHPKIRGGHQPKKKL